MTDLVESNIAVEARELGKVYRVYRNYGRGWLLSKLLPFVDRNRFSQDVDALHDVSFTLPRGEVLGIVGRNGSGKSTLLKLVAGLTWPTSGTVKVNGRVRALMSLGVNFHQGFSGRENILFGSMAMGIPPKVVRERVESIIEFAELEEHIDMPIQFYSSGMRARLAAAVSFQEAAEILIIDEALSAGDAYFVNKCMARIEDLCRSGSTVLFVSHGIALVERLCTRAILLERGRMLEQGKPSVVVSEYRRVLVDHEISRVHAAGSKPLKMPVRELAAVAVPETPEPTAEPELKPKTSGTNEIELVDFHMLDGNGEKVRCFDHGAPMTVVVVLNAVRHIPKMRFYFELYSEFHGVKIAEIGSAYQSAATGKYAPCFPENLDGQFEIRMHIPENPLGSGTYYWNVFFAAPAREMKYDAPSQYFCQAYNVSPFVCFSFPGNTWARDRKAILEPAVEFQLIREAEKPEAAERANP